jgi:hypothetical protein
MSAAIFAAVLSWLLSVEVAPRPARDPGAGSRAPRSLLTDFRERRALQRAWLGAMRQLESEECQKLLTDFTDAEGRVLERRLAALQLSPVDYLAIVLFVSGAQLDACARAQTLAVTTPGHRVVYVCGHNLVPVADSDPGFASALILHEVLHTLGLGENPPSPQQITAHVRSRCAP